MKDIPKKDIPKELTSAPTLTKGPIMEQPSTVMMDISKEPASAPSPAKGPIEEQVSSTEEIEQTCSGQETKTRNTPEAKGCQE